MRRRRSSRTGCCRRAEGQAGKWIRAVAAVERAEHGVAAAAHRDAEDGAVADNATAYVSRTAVNRRAVQGVADERYSTVGI